MASSQGSKEFKYQTDFPSFYSTSVTRVSQDTNRNKPNIVRKTKHLTVVASRYSYSHVSEKNKSKFHELQLVNNDNGTNLTYKILETDNKWKQANFDIISQQHAYLFNTYLINNNKHFVSIFLSAKEYNIYDMENDKWFFSKNKRISFAEHQPSRQQNIMITDNLILVSYNDKLEFFGCFVNDHVTRPIVRLREYLFKINKNTDNNKSKDIKRIVYSYGYHGICCTNIKSKYLAAMNKSDGMTDLKFTIILFGGSVHSNIDFLSSFLVIDINVILKDVYNDNTYNSDRYILDRCMFREKPINKNLIKCVNFNKETLDEATFSSFAFECVWNGKNEAIIMIIGGSINCGENKSIYLYNTANHELSIRENVKCCLKMLVL